MTHDKSGVERAMHIEMVFKVSYHLLYSSFKGRVIISVIENNMQTFPRTGLLIQYEHKVGVKER